MITFPILAEVSDKVASPSFSIGCAVVTAVFALPMLKSRWMLLIALPAALFSAGVIAITALPSSEPDIVDAVIHEFGSRYFTTAWASGLAPFVLIFVLLFRRTKHA